MRKDRVAIVAGVRTPFVRARGVFRHLPASTLGGAVLQETVTRSGIDPSLIEDITLGIVCAPAEGTHVAREALFDSVLPRSIPCTTVNRYCASSSEAIACVTAKILSGAIDTGLAAGVESLSSVRALFSHEATDFFQSMQSAKTFKTRLNAFKHLKSSHFIPEAPGIKEPTTGLTMGQSADLMARLFQISRNDQDAYARDSHKKAFAAWESKLYNVMPLMGAQGGLIERDTDVRQDTEKLASLRPVFYPDGTVTAGNASPLTDGASSVLLMRASKAQELGLPILGTIRSIASSAIDISKEPLLIAPIYAVPKALKQAGVTLADIDAIEMHEAFAAQVLATVKTLAIDMNKMNLWGGSVALGHPFGATGVRLLLQLLAILKHTQKNLGLISICAAGGLGMSMVVEAH